MRKAIVLGVSAAMLMLAGCGEVQRRIQDGPTAITYVDPPIRLMRETPRPEPRHCPISMLMRVKYLDEQKWDWYRVDKWFSDDKPDQFFDSCPEEKINLPTWKQAKLEWTPSIFRTVAPAVTNALGWVAAAGTLGAVMPGTTVTNSGVNIRASTVAGEVPGGVPR